MLHLIKKHISKSTLCLNPDDRHAVQTCSFRWISFTICSSESNEAMWLTHMFYLFVESTCSDQNGLVWPRIVFWGCTGWSFVVGKCYYSCFSVEKGRLTWFCPSFFRIGS
jgi:hypothetical protein